MPSPADKKFDQFTQGNEMQVGDIAVGLRSSNLATNYKFDFPGNGFKDSSGNYLLQYATAGTLAVNFPKIVNSLTNQPIIYTVDGSDTNVDIAVTPKGSGALYLDGLKWPTADGSDTQVVTTDGNGNLSFQDVDSEGLPYTEVLGTSQVMEGDNAYGANNASLVTLTLPLISTAGMDIQVVWKGAGGWRIAQNAGQSIIHGNKQTTVGVGGSLSSTDVGDTITIKCTTENLTWIVMHSQGNIAYV